MTSVRTKRWDDPVDDDDGTRILICRYRPRALPKADETWSEWNQRVAPSKELHAAVYGKTGDAISWDEYRARFAKEMSTMRARAAIDALAYRVHKGEQLTLLCSSQCTDSARCHRTIIAALVEERAKEID
jgi:uncharacterized protein YeaO (DUF488 family)